MKHIQTFESFLNEGNDLSYWKDYADGSSQSPKWYSNDAKNPSAVNKLVNDVVNHELDELNDKDADIDPSDMKTLTDLAMKYFKKFGSINGHIVSAMLFQEAKESFMNEAKNLQLGPKTTKFEKIVEGMIISFLEAVKNENQNGEDLSSEYYAAIKSLGIKEDSAMICSPGTVGSWNKILDSAKKVGLKYAEVKDSKTGDNAIVFSAQQ